MFSQIWRLVVYLVFSYIWGERVILLFSLIHLHQQCPKQSCSVEHERSCLTIVRRCVQNKTKKRRSEREGKWSIAEKMPLPMLTPLKLLSNKVSDQNTVFRRFCNTRTREGNGPTSKRDVYLTTLIKYVNGLQRAAWKRSRRRGRVDLENCAYP